VQWRLADLLEYVPPRQAFDLVAVFYLHIPDPGMSEILGRAAGALDAGGTLLVVGHDPSNITAGHGGPQDPAILMAPEQIVAAIEDLHLQVQRAERVLRPVAAGDEEVVAIDALVRAVMAR
jgi:hypothetical protein